LENPSIIASLLVPNACVANGSTQIAASHARALGLKAAVVLPFEQPVGALIHSQRVGAKDLGRQASRDLTSEAMKPREAA
jgi:hypothetical protein